MDGPEPATAVSSPKPRIVILGAGFGGLFAARGLRRAAAEITVVDRNNYHLFQPLLYQVAGAALAPSDIAWPVRSLLKRQHNTRVLMAEVTDIDRRRNLVITDRGEIGYDYLVVATGSRNHYFSHPRWQDCTLGLKDLNDATAIRAHVLNALERAETSADEAERRRLLSVVIIGGGPTGIEMAGIIAELGRRALASDFRGIARERLRVVLTEGAGRLLGSFPEHLSAYANTALERLGVEVRTGRFVDRIEPGVVTVAGERLQAATIIWCAGVSSTPAARWLGVEHDKKGRIPVTGQLRLEEAPEVFVIGDIARVRDRRGEPLPCLAPVAKQQGRFVARCIRRELARRPPAREFRYRDYGTLATIGRGCAVADFGRFATRGWLTWWFWGFSHIYFLIARQLRILVALKWLFEYVTFQRGSRLILK